MNGSYMLEKLVKRIKSRMVPYLITVRKLIFYIKESFSKATTFNYSLQNLLKSFCFSLFPLN